MCGVPNVTISNGRQEMLLPIIRRAATDLVQYFALSIAITVDPRVFQHIDLAVFGVSLSLHLPHPGPASGHTISTIISNGLHRGIRHDWVFRVASVMDIDLISGPSPLGRLGARCDAL